MKTQWTLITSTSPNHPLGTWWFLRSSNSGALWVMIPMRGRGGKAGWVPLWIMDTESFPTFLPRTPEKWMKEAMNYPQWEDRLSLHSVASHASWHQMAWNVCQGREE